MLLPGIGETGQRALLDSHVLIVGCGALGSIIADALARAGVGTLTIVDRDIVEYTNLQRQVLYSEADAREGAAKAVAAHRRLATVNSTITIHAHADDLNAGNIARFARGVDVIVDGLDNFETRYVLNDYCVQQSIPYVYGGAVATIGMGLVVLPAGRESNASQRVRWSSSQATPCLRCVFPEAPPPGSSPTCDTAGVLGAAVNIVASWQVAQTIKLLTGNVDAIDRRMLSIDIWRNELRSMDVSAAGPSEQCPCCGQRQFGYLKGAAASRATSMCGRNSVQVLPETTSGSQSPSLDLGQLARRLAEHGTFRVNSHLLRGTFAGECDAGGDPLELTLFANGRAIIKGTDEPGRARSVYARYIGL